MTITIIGGCPGTGKTTLASRLAKNNRRGVHVETDRFFDFIANKIDPSKPGAHQQNEVVLTAWCAATLAYQAAGYEVFIDGVIGPWWFEQLKAALGDFHYVMLRSDLQTCLDRVATREDQASATVAVVRRMHEQFESAATEYSGIILNTTGRSPDALLEMLYRDNGLR